MEPARHELILVAFGLQALHRVQLLTPALRSTKTQTSQQRVWPRRVAFLLWSMSRQGTPCRFGRCRTIRPCTYLMIFRQKKVTVRLQLDPTLSSLHELEPAAHCVRGGARDAGETNVVGMGRTGGTPSAPRARTIVALVALTCHRVRRGARGARRAHVGGMGIAMRAWAAAGFRSARILAICTRLGGHGFARPISYPTTVCDRIIGAEAYEHYAIVSCHRTRNLVARCVEKPNTCRAFKV